MATKANPTEMVIIKPVEKMVAEITIIGETPLIVHAWSEKAKKEILDAQQGKKKGKKSDVRNPVEDFIRSLYWLTGMPTIPDNATTDQCEAIFEQAVEEGAVFGFPAVAIKKAAVSAAYRQGYTKDKVSANGSFWLNGINDPEFVEIESTTPPIMREDMVKIGMGTADLRYRAEFRDWKARCRLSYIKDGALSLENIVNMINLGGFCCGLGEWRAEKGGISGAFRVQLD